jgi:hypothetical protein
MPMRPDGYSNPHSHVQLQEGEDPAAAAARLRLSEIVGEIAYSFYPNHPWKIEIKPPNKFGQDGVIQIQLAPWMGPKLWYTIWTDSVRTHNDMRIRVMRVCGEILERYQVPRQGFSGDEFHSAMQSLPIQARTFHGFIPE